MKSTWVVLLCFLAFCQLSFLSLAQSINGTGEDEGPVLNWMEAILYPETFGNDTNVTGSPQFGYSSAISADGSVIVVGAPFTNDDVGGSGSKAGLVYIFKREMVVLAPNSTNSTTDENSTTTTTTNTTTEDDEVAQWTLLGTLSPDVYVNESFVVDQTNWKFGQSVSISHDGNVVLVGAPGASFMADGEGPCTGGAFVFVAQNTSSGNDTVVTYVQSQRLNAPSNASKLFGRSVALDSMGMRAIVGSPKERIDSFCYAGAAHVFQRTVEDDVGSAWEFVASVLPTNFTGRPHFGWSVAIADQGTTVLVGAPFDDTEGPDVGVAHVFQQDEFDATTWTMTATWFPHPLYANESSTTNLNEHARFGWSVAISNGGAAALVGAMLDDTAGVDAGAVYVYAIPMVAEDDNTTTTTASNSSSSNATASEWEEQAVLVPSIDEDFPYDNATSHTTNSSSNRTVEGHMFGFSVAITGDGSRAIVGSVGDDTVHPGAGAGYVFVLDDQADEGGDSLNTTDFNANNTASTNETNSTAPSWVILTRLYPVNYGGEVPCLGYSSDVAEDGTAAVIAANGDDVVGDNAGSAYAFGLWVEPDDDGDRSSASTLGSTLLGVMAWWMR